MKIDKPLVSTQWLAEHLDNPNLRVFDTTIVLQHKTDGFGYVPQSGRADWEKSHVPGAGFLDVISELSDQDSDIPFMMPPADKFAATLGIHGIDDSSTVVLYNKGMPMWSTRVWWMMRSIGFDQVAVLDGGWEKWCAESRPVSGDPSNYPAGKITVNERPECWVDRGHMESTVEQGGEVTINALSPAVYSGEKNQYGRAGHLPGTYNVFYGELIDEQSGTFLPPETLRQLFERSGALSADRVVTYCGGGISATMDCLALALCGQHNVAVYDGSMSEWVRDESLPLKLGDEP